MNTIEVPIVDMVYKMLRIISIHCRHLSMILHRNAYKLEIEIDYL